MIDRLWSLVTVETERRVTMCAALVDDVVVELPALAGLAGVFEALQDWPALEPRLRAADPRAGEPLPGARLLAPIRYPRAVLCSGANYRDHLAEMTGHDTTEVSPYFFLKPPTTSVIGPGEPIRIPEAESAQVDWEAELGVVIGRGGRDISEETAFKHIAGYTIVNDVSARGPHHRPDAIAAPFAWDWLASKGGDTFCPTGPGLTPAWLVPDPHDLPIRLAVNGVVRQASSTAQMIQPIERLVAHASWLVTLQPGDLLATGTPAGVGLPRNQFLRAGDTVEITIGPLGTLRNPVVTQAAFQGDQA
jgi:2-keto-4-pentenoate hydratase/2-oxohepta-3-ene-1,7-dioic acid hydratase in catechol pathway